MAGGIAHGKEDGLVFAARSVERFLTPRIPVDRIMRMLEKIWAFLAYQTVGPGMSRLLRCGRFGRGQIAPLTLASAKHNEKAEHSLQDDGRRPKSVPGKAANRRRATSFISVSAPRIAIKISS